MKAPNLYKLMKALLFLKKWWWVVPILICVGWEVLKYRRTIKEIKKLEHVPAVVPVVVESMPRTLDKMKADEILIIRKDNENLVKLILLPDSALQHWADSLLNAPAARGQRF